MPVPNCKISFLGDGSDENNNEEPSYSSNDEYQDYGEMKEEDLTPAQK